MRAALALTALVLVRAAAASPAAVFDYLYVEANEGGSSGGHVAIRLGNETYHFQQVSLGLLQLERDDSADFVHRYAGIQNRPVHASRIAVSPEQYRTLRTAFAERYLREQKLFAHADALRDDGVVLRALLARRRGEPARIAVRAAGYFLPAGAGAAPSEVLAGLRARIEATYGRGVLRRRAARVRERLAALRPAPGVAPADVPASGYPVFPRTYSERYRDLATELVALDVLDRRLALRLDAIRTGTDAALAIDAGARRSLEAFADGLADALVRLVATDRPELGLAMLIGMARLEAVDRSLRSGRLALLDVFPPDAVAIHSGSRGHREALHGLRAEAAAGLARLRARLDRPLAEADVAAIESAGNRLIELERAIAGDAGLRVTTARLEPSRESAWTEAVVPAVDEATLVRAVAAADAARGRFESALRERLGYDLVARNCVSELFRTLEAADVSVGGAVGAPWSLEFIPFVAARAVDERWPVAARTTLPSYRHAWIDALARREGWLARVRESNVVTSTIYRWNEADSAFLFFTDDALLPRPALGAMNLAVALGAGIAGLPLLPFDGARLLSAGLRGILYSAPELAFVNLRKGSFDYVPAGYGEERGWSGG